MKKLLLVIFLGVMVACILPAQDLLPLGRDLETMMEKLGHDVIPYLQQIALSGEGIGAAEFRSSSGFFFAISAGAVISHGIGTFLDDAGTFELLDVNGMLETAVEGTSLESSYEDAKSTFPYPSLRVAFGFRSLFDSELIFTFSIFPQFVTDTIANAASMEGLTLNRMNAGVRARKILIDEDGGFPAISLGIGYIFSMFNVGYELPEDFSQDVSGFPLSIQGDLGIHTMLNSFGMDLTVSKSFGVFVPFITVSPWYQWAHYSAEVKDFDAQAGTADYTNQGGKDPKVDIDVLDLAVLFSGGFEVKLGGFALVTTASYSLYSQAFGASLGARFQF